MRWKSAPQCIRATEWSRGADGEAGLGQRLWMLSGGEDVDILSLRKLVMV